MEDHYQTFLHTYDCRDLIKLIKTISTRQAAAVVQGRKFSQTDERYMKKAKDLLNNEFAIALDIPKASVGNYIDARVTQLENTGIAQ